MTILRLETSISVPCIAGAYTAGDSISNHATSPTDITVAVPSNIGPFRIVRASLGDTPASASVVITNMVLDMLVFKTADAPALINDNTTMPLTATVRQKAAKFTTTAAGWINQLGAAAAGTSCIQQMNPFLAEPAGGFVFRFAPPEAETLSFRFQAKAAWTPLAVTNAFTIVIDIETIDI